MYTKNGEILTAQQVRDAHPNIMLPEPLPADWLATEGYAQYLPEPSPPQATAISALQGELAIESAGLWEQYQTFIASMPVRDRIVWQREPVWRIDDPRIIAGAAAMGIGAEGLRRLLDSARNGSGSSIHPPSDVSL